MTDVPPLTRRIVRIRRLLVVVLIVVFAVLAVRAVFDVWMARRLNGEVARLEKRYGPLTWDPRSQARRRQDVATPPRAGEQGAPVGRRGRPHYAERRVRGISSTSPTCLRQ